MYTKKNYVDDNKSLGKHFIKKRDLKNNTIYIFLLIFFFMNFETNFHIFSLFLHIKVFYISILNIWMTHFGKIIIAINIMKLKFNIFL